VTYLKTDREGRLDVKALERAMTEKTILVSVMTANTMISASGSGVNLAQSGPTSVIWPTPFASTLQVVPTTRVAGVGRVARATTTAIASTAAAAKSEPENTACLPKFHTATWLT